MKNLFDVLLILHIGSGFAALTAGLIAILSRKGETIHRKAGKIFYYAMIIVGCSAIGLCLMKRNDFLFAIAVFSLYMVLTGYRNIQNKTDKSNFFDWILIVAALGTTVWMFIQQSIVLYVFGTILFLFAIRDLISVYQRAKNIFPRQRWLLNHVSRMLGGYIAAVTAFCVVNFSKYFHHDSVLIVWLGPTVIGSLLITYFIFRIRKNQLPLTISDPSVIEVTSGDFNG